MLAMSFARPVVLLAVVVCVVTSSALACGGPSKTVSEGGPPDASTEGGGGPYLTSLSVTSAGDASPGLTLVPPFSSGVYDYYVRCGSAGANALTVSMTASTGSLGQLLLPTMSAGKATQTLSASVVANKAIEAVATKGAASTQYWVRCLPPDFPPIQMTVNADAGAAQAGYYLVGPMELGVPAYAMIVDGNGVPVWYSSVPDQNPVVDVDSLVRGEVTYTGDPAPTTFQRIDPLSAAPESIAPKGYATDFHDLRLTPAGTYVVFSYPLEGGVDLSGIALPLSDGGTEQLPSDAVIQDCVAVEFKADGTVVSTWAASDHFDPSEDVAFIDSTFVATVTQADGGPVYDVFHCNSIDVDPANGNYLISSRNMSSVFYVDRSTDGGKVLWKMGGKEASKDLATYVSVPSPFVAQHDGRLVAGWKQGCNGGTGQVSVFDDESASLTTPGKPARGVIYDVIVGADGGGGGGCGDGGGPVGSATVASQYPTEKFSLLGGSVRISPADGSVIVGWGLNIAQSIVFSEYDRAGTDLRDFSMPGWLGSYRAVKVPTTWFSLDLMRQTAGDT
jgi:Arylsulfotransferase (ASST)